MKGLKCQAQGFKSDALGGAILGTVLQERGMAPETCQEDLPIFRDWSLYSRVKRDCGRHQG